MKHALKHIAVSMLAFCAMMPAIAKTVDSGDDDSTAAEMPAVPAAIKKIKFINGKPNLKARYYIYLYVLDGPGDSLNSCIGEIAKQYKKMKSANVEVILVGHNMTEKAAKACLSMYKAKFPGILDSDPMAATLPGNRGSELYPKTRIVTADGEQLDYIHAKFIGEGQWKGIIGLYEHDHGIDFNSKKPSQKTKVDTDGGKQ